MSDLNKQSTAFQQTHPLGFNLYDDDEQQVLSISDDASGNKMHLEIRNTSRYSINLSQSADGGDAATVGNNHFELRFRPGTLLASVLGKLSLAEVSLNESPMDVKNWRLGFANQTDGTTSLFILATKAQAAVTLAPDASLKITLQNISADGRGGARGTRVELKYRRLAYVGETLPVSGASVQHLSIVNQRGKKNIALHVGFLGSNTILNDGNSLNQVILRIANASKNSPIPLSKVKDAPSKFVVSFDVQDSNEAKEWALMQSGELKAVNVYVKFTDTDSWNLLTPADRGQGESPEWVIENKSLEQLSPGQHIQVKISGIKSALSSGQSNLYVRYENIPGYWDGQFITALEKSNLVQRDVFGSNGLYAGKSTIGIGTNDPKARLHVAGDALLNGNLTVDTGKIGVGTAPTAQLDVKGTANVWAGENYAVKSGFMAPGSLTVGNINANYGGTNGWSNNTAGLLLETKDNTEIAVHDSLRRVASLMYYEGGDVNRITIGRNMGWDAVRTLSINGSVGIGTPDPGASKLKITNSATDFAHVRFAADGAGEFEIVGWSAGWNINAKTPGKSLYINRDTSSDVLIGAYGKELLIKGNSGNVGVGASAPGARLTVQTGGTNANAYSAGKALFVSCPMGEGKGMDGGVEFRHDNLSQGIGFGYNTIYATGYNDNQDLTIQSKGGAGHVCLNPAQGNVGIGMTNPTAPLHVGKAWTIGHSVQDQYAYLSYQWNAHSDNQYGLGLSDRGRNGFDATSICAEGRIVGTQFNAFSDSRIKKNRRVSDLNADLNLLKQLKVTDYQFKDFLAHGDRQSKGFIAEEVEQLFSQAVNYRSDFIPDIYAFSDDTTLVDEVLTVSLTDAHNLAAGDVVRLITKAAGVCEARVEVVDEKTFSVNDWKENGGKLFVYGRRVDDFRTVDYQQIFALGIGGIQQLAREVDELKSVSDTLKRRLQSMESKMETVPKFAAAMKTA